MAASLPVMPVDLDSTKDVDCAACNSPAGKPENIKQSHACPLAFDRLLRDRVGLAPLYLRDIARDDLCFYFQLCAGAACGIVVAGGDFARIERVITLGRPKNQRAESR
jgi:hypothetical protein